MILRTNVRNKDISKSVVGSHFSPLKWDFYIGGIIMIKIKCKYCNYKLEKHRWEHIIAAVRKQGGHAGKNICPECKAKGLRLDWGKEE